MPSPVLLSMMKHSPTNITLLSLQMHFDTHTCRIIVAVHVSAICRFILGSSTVETKRPLLSFLNCSDDSSTAFSTQSCILFPSRSSICKIHIGCQCIRIRRWLGNKHCYSMFFGKVACLQNHNATYLRTCSN